LEALSERGSITDKGWRLASEQALPISSTKRAATRARRPKAGSSGYGALQPKYWELPCGGLDDTRETRMVNAQRHLRTRTAFRVYMDKRKARLVPKRQ
jgi:hypothetical protein